MDGSTCWQLVITDRVHKLLYSKTYSLVSFPFPLCTLNLNVTFYLGRDKWVNGYLKSKCMYVKKRIKYAFDVYVSYTIRDLLSPAWINRKISCLTGELNALKQLANPLVTMLRHNFFF